MFFASDLKASLVDSAKQKDIENSGKPTTGTRTSASSEDFHYRLPFSSQTYYMMRPIENGHIYLWIIKDLSWAQDWYYPSLIFGSLALVWCGVLMIEAMRMRSAYEVYMTVGITLWLAANFTWMTGEVVNSDDDNVIPPSAIMMESAIAWILLYYVVLKPLNLLTIDSEYTAKLKAVGLSSRFGYFESWREYEHLHTLLWLCKDLSWNQREAAARVIFIIPTFLIGADFVYQTWRTKYMFIDCSHYMAQLMWVTGNAIWAVSEIFDIKGNDDDRDPHSIWHTSSEASKKLRWWASLRLLLALVPILWLYMVWYPLTCAEQIKAAEIEQNNSSGSSGRDYVVVVVEITWKRVQRIVLLLAGQIIYCSSCFLLLVSCYVL